MHDTCFKTILYVYWFMFTTQTKCTAHTVSRSHSVVPEDSWSCGMLSCWCYRGDDLKHTGIGVILSPRWVENSFNV